MFTEIANGSRSLFIDNNGLPGFTNSSTTYGAAWVPSGDFDKIKLGPKIVLAMYGLGISFVL